LDVEFEDIQRSLVHVRGALLFNAWGQLPGQVFAGKRFYRFVRVCLLLGDRELVQTMWREQVERELRVGEEMEQGVTKRGQHTIKRLDAERLVTILADDLKEWRMLLWMLDPALFPAKLHTSATLQRYLQAHLATRQPGRVQAIFDTHAELGLTPAKESYNHLVQAKLALGDVVGGRAAILLGRKEGKLDRHEQQMAILRGHRDLGGTAHLQDRVLKNLKSLGEAPLGSTINALIRLRVDQGDMHGAERLLSFHRLDKFADTSSGVEGWKSFQPTSKDAAFLALKVASRQGDLPRAREIWAELFRTNYADINDNHLSQMVSALCHGGERDEAFNFVMSMVDPDWAYRPNISWPGTAKPGIRTLNALLNAVPKRHFGLAPLHKVLRLYPRLGVSPDQSTMKIILNVVGSYHMPPEEMAALLRDLYRMYPDVFPDIGQLNVILAAAMRSNLTSPRTQLHAPPLSSSSDSNTSPSAGLTAFKPLRYAIEPVLASLEERGARSNSQTVAIRLRYDALTHASVGGFPTADAVWRSLIDRGFHPDKRHVLALMLGYAQSGAMAEATSVMALAKEVDVEPTNGMWMALLVGWAREGDVARARAAYRKIEASSEGVDIVAVTAMVQANYYALKFDGAADMVRTVLLPKFGDKLDRQALLVATHALKSNNEEMAALELVDRNKGRGLMGRPLRNVVRKLRNWLTKKVQAETETDGQEEQEGQGGMSMSREGREFARGLQLCERILEDGDEVRRPKGYEAVRADIQRSLTPRGFKLEFTKKK
jgi:hypothetical protein